jgi:hypothetical protein
VCSKVSTIEFQLSALRVKSQELWQRDSSGTQEGSSIGSPYQGTSEGQQNEKTQVHVLRTLDCDRIGNRTRMERN